MKREDFEIMAPVGSYESLNAAISAHADAVYFGVEGLNMRSRSSMNFGLDDLKNISEICRNAGLKTYLTVNTIIYDDDFENLQRILKSASTAGITAIIASDMAAILAAREMGLEVHISTQTNISNFEALKFYSQWADVCVLARELSLDQVKKINEQIISEKIIGPSGNPVRIEMFCHGALCMAVSGKCYLSLHEMNASANRGACTQICRRGYSVTDMETGDELVVDNKYIMSPKDLKTIHFLDRMIDAGVRVFKIEGRARGPEYVYTTVSAYNQALNAICDGSYGKELVENLDVELKKVFNRGFWNGYYLGQRLGEWSGKYGSSATRVKRYVAKGMRYFPKLGVGEFLMESGELNVSDEVVLTGPTTGALIFKVSEIRVDLKSVDKAIKGEHFSMPVPAKIRPADKLYVWDVKNV